MERVGSHVLVLAFLIALASSDPFAVMSMCPVGTQEAAGSCVLDSDLVLEAPIELPSHTTLNCRGHRILPAAAGTGTTAETYAPSTPAVALAITGARAVDVRNCVIGEEGRRFDFGIVAINSKNAGKSGHRIHDNEIHARDIAITLLRVDDARVSDNVITWSNGFGISFARDSDRNRVTANDMSSRGLPPAPFRLVPGGPLRNGSDDAIFLVNIHTQPLYNLVIGGRLYQFPNLVEGQYPSHDDNVVESNRVSLPGPSTGKTHHGIDVGSNASGTRVIGNTFVQGGIGVRMAGFMPAHSVPRVAQCVSPRGQQVARYCATDGDCFIPEIDDAPAGTCPALVTDTRDLRARGTVVEHNLLVGPFNFADPVVRAAIFGGNGTSGGVIRGNTIFGSGGEPGITLAGNSFETAEVTRNVVHGASFGLSLQQNNAALFGARVYQNDFTGSAVRAVDVRGPLNFRTELSFDGAGNYWGHSTAPCFRPSDSPVPQLIHDSFPFCVPVAQSSASRRP
jgi:hypothetical protein